MLRICLPGIILTLFISIQGCKIRSSANELFSQNPARDCNPRLVGTSDAQLEILGRHLETLCLVRSEIWKNSRFGDFPIYLNHLTSSNLIMFSFGKQTLNKIDVIKRYLPENHNGGAWSLFRDGEMEEVALVIERDVEVFKTLWNRLGVKEGFKRDMSLTPEGIVALAFHEHLHWKLQSEGVGSLGLWASDRYLDVDSHEDGDWPKVDRFVEKLVQAALASGEQRTALTKEALQMKLDIKNFYADYRERFEGIAQYAEYFSYLRLTLNSLTKKNQLLAQLKKMLTDKSSLEFASKNRSQYYLIGALACLMLREADPEERSWEKEIEDGKSPTEVLFQKI